MPEDHGTLEWAREKKRWLVASLSYRVLVPLATRLFGRRRVLAFLLDVNLLSHRLAFEQAGKLWGEGYTNEVLGLDSATLSRWITTGASVVDLGCGYGRGVQMALEAGAGRSVGIDYSAETIEGARVKYPGSSFILGDITRALADQLPGRFDIAMLTHVLEHIEDPVAFLSQTRDVADDLIVEVPDVDANWTNLPRRRLGLRLYTDDDHVREYSSSLLSSHLRAGGWRVEELTHIRGVLIAFARKDPS